MARASACRTRGSSAAASRGLPCRSSRVRRSPESSKRLATGGVQPGEREYASLFPPGGGFAELALASADRLAARPGQASFAEAARLVIGGGTAYEGLVDRGRLQPGETVLITAAAGGVGSAAIDRKWTRSFLGCGDGETSPDESRQPSPAIDNRRSSLRTSLENR